MKLKTALLLGALLIAMLIPQCSFASGDGLGRAVIVSDTSSSVNLRDFCSPDAKDLGEYDVGTEVRILESGQEDGWVVVEIGAERGYLPSANLSFDNSITPKWKKAVVNIAGTDFLSVREEANEGAAAIGSVQRGAVVTVMGETEKHWCYIQTDTLYGYLPASQLLIGTTALPDEPTTPTSVPQPADPLQQANKPQQTQAPATTAPAQGNWGTAFVTAQTSKRVNLRASASVGSRSMGLYYVGTQVQCLSDPSMEWVHVSIGNRSGYMKSEYLYTGAAPLVSRQPSAVLSNGSKTVSLRQEPSSGSAPEAELKKGDAVTVLGEMDTGWSYVCTGTACGYVMSKYLMVSEAESPSATARPSPAPDASDDAQTVNYVLNDYTPSPFITIQYPAFGDEKLNIIILDKLGRMAENITEGAAMRYSCAVTCSMLPQARRNCAQHALRSRDRQRPF